jgi:hypothetical protein
MTGHHRSHCNPKGSESDSGRRREGRRRKERVLHTRISEDLAEDIRRMAEDLRVPVSNIVRNVLEEAFTVVEQVTDNMGDLIEDVMDEAEAARDRIRERQRHTRGRSRRSSRRRSSVRSDRVEGVEDDFEASEAAAPASDPVLGWQPLILAQAQRCEACETEVARGSQAFAGVTARGLGASYRCASCVAELQQDDA